MTTLVGDTQESDVWMHGLRDADTQTWSRPVRSKQLDAAYVAVHGGSGRPFPHEDNSSRGDTLGSRGSSPKLKRGASFKVLGAVETEGDLRAVGLCQKPAALRSQEDIKFIVSYMCSLSYFFSLWPAPLQRELSRLLSAHILARREVALTRGRAPDRLYFVVQGRLDVRLPVPTPGGGREERTLAVLTRGHTVGEAVLLGAQAQHTTVVVSSSSAILLSLSRPDFSRAFKEVLDIRQAERLSYIRMHPLLANSGLELRDLEAASEVLGLAFFPPGTRLWPMEERERCLYFLAEGQAKVKRPGGAGAGAAPAAVLHHLDPSAAADGAAASAPSMYDRFTVSMLGPGDIFGLPSTEQALTLHLQQAVAAGAADASQPGSPPGTANVPGTAGTMAHAQASSLTAAGSHLTAGGGGGAGGPAGGSGTAGGGSSGHGAATNVVIESYTQVKVYIVKYADYPRLPVAVQQVLQAANAFRWSYYEGRIVGLAKMDTRRREAQREQLMRKKNNAAFQRRADGTDGPLQSVWAAVALEQAMRDKVLLARTPQLNPAGMVQAATAGTLGFGGGGVQAAQQERARWHPGAAGALEQTEVGAEASAGAGAGPGAGASYSPGLPSWALPGGAGDGRLGVDPATSPGDAKDSNSAQMLDKQQQPQPGRPGSTGAASVSVSVSASGAGPGAGGVGGGGAGASSTRGLNPLLQRNKALMAVQAQQLSRVLAAERESYAQRQPVLHPLEGGSTDYEGAAWAMWDSSNSQSFPRVRSQQRQRNEVVETEKPRTVEVPQTLRQRHVIMFQNAQNIAAAASSTRPWSRPVQQPRPAYSRALRGSQAGAGSSGGGSSSSEPHRSGGGALPLPASRFGADGAFSTAPHPARTGSGGRPQRPDDRLSRYGSTGRSSSASGGRASASGGSGQDGGVANLLGDLPSPKAGFGRAAAPSAAAASAAAAAAGAASPELSFSHLGIRDDEEGDGGSDDVEELEVDLLYAEADDQALLSRVPMSLLGGGKGGAKGAHTAGGDPGGGHAEAAREHASKGHRGTGKQHQQQAEGHAGTSSGSPAPASGSAAAAPGAQATGKAAGASRSGASTSAASGRSPSSGTADVPAPALPASGGLGGLNSTLRRKGAGAPAASASAGAAKPAAAHSPATASGGGGLIPLPALPAGSADTVGGEGRGASRQLFASSRPSAASRSTSAEFPMDLDESSLHAHHPPTHRGTAGSVQHSAAHMPAASGGALTTRGINAARDAPSLVAAQASSDQPQQQQPVGLPPGIALGYESLDPFAWAALAAQVGPGIRTPFSQENILPKPQW